MQLQTTSPTALQQSCMHACYCHTMLTKTIESGEYYLGLFCIFFFKFFLENFLKPFMNKESVFYFVLVVVCTCVIVKIFLYDKFLVPRHKCLELCYRLRIEAGCKRPPYAAAAPLSIVLAYHLNFSLICKKLNKNKKKNHKRISRNKKLF